MNRFTHDDIVRVESLPTEGPRGRGDVVFSKAEFFVKVQALLVGQEASQHDLGDGWQVGGDGGVEAHEQRAEASAGHVSS